MGKPVGIIREIEMIYDGKVGVIVPVYNVERHLRRCIESILAQTFYQFELILVDDGSTDASGKICDEYEEKDRRIRVIHKKNGGVSSARNRGIEESVNEYLAFVDSDDFIDRKYLEILFQSMEKNQADLIICNSTQIDEGQKTERKECEDKELLSEPEIISRAEAYRRMLIGRQATFAPWGKLYRRELFHSVCYPEGEIFEDISVIDKIVEASNVIVYVDYGGYYYLARKESIVHGKVSIDHWAVIDNSRYLLEFICDAYPELEDEARIHYYGNCFYLLSKMVMDLKYQRECLLLKRDILREWHYLMFHKEICITQKYVIICLALGLPFYKFAKKVAEKAKLFDL